MKNWKHIVAALCMAILLCNGSVWADGHAGPAAVQVVAVDTHGKTDEYLKGIQSLPKVMARLSPGADVRVYEAAFSGQSTGTVYVVITFPSLDALAKATAKTSQDKEWQSVIEKLDAMGRTLTSNSVLMDRTPK